eukprot:TRINITY_DN703_c0_g1_i2.p1 TRINITY_DN703_c0_g1~~TRINITY_DN703_c0_g1_i2.p1  ORF type:complete len:415 (+),score=94.04 TRINITY_DN703_c0_g1_i2:49-1293(+)
MRVLSAFLCSLLASGAQSSFVARLNGDAELLRKISATPCEKCNTEHGLVDLWKPAVEGRHVTDNWKGQIDVRGDNELKALLKSMNHSIVHQNIEETIQAEKVRLSTRSNATATFFDDYRDYDEMLQRMDYWVSSYQGVTSITAGVTYEGRQIKGVRFGNSPTRHVVWIQCGIHAREWIAPATCMWFTERLLDLQNSDPTVRDILSKLEVYVIPVLNVDGYRYSWTNNRLWRKNRQPNSDGSVGTDLNRNWDADWGKCGASTNPSSDTYRGTGPFSAPESDAVRQTMAILKGAGYQILGGHDFHSYGQLLLRPYGWTSEDTPNNAIEEERGQKMCDAITATSGLHYTNQKSFDLYCCSGLACDWIAEQTVEASGFTFELRGTPGGFVLPPDQIIPSGEEIYAAMLVWFREMLYEV